MKSQTFLLIIIILLLAIPMDFKPSPNLVAAKEDVSTYIGYSSVTNNDLPESKEPEKVEQRCHGTRKLLSGDGITEYDCPGCPDCEGLVDNNNSSTKCQCGCGKDNCTCGKTAASACAVQDEELPKAYMIWFTAKWCGPCQHFKKFDVPKLKKSDWMFGDKLVKGLHVLEVDIDENPKLYREIMESLPEELKKKQKGTIPAFIFMRDGKVQDMTEHYLNYKDFADFFNTNMEKK